MKLAAIVLLLALTLSVPAGTDPVTRSAAPGEAAAASGTADETETEDETMEEFVPSEALSADTAVSFPVDI